jgi:hypothetical protein
MKCKKCGSKASVNMRQHKLALCKEHYLEWMPEQTERFIKKYEMFTHHEKILVAVSGGKDSLGLWDILRGWVIRQTDFILGLGLTLRLRSVQVPAKTIRTSHSIWLKSLPTKIT